MLNSRFGNGAGLIGTGVLVLTLVGCSSGSGSSETEEGDAFPDRAIEYVVPYAPGGSTDPVGREYSRLLAEELGTTATVQNLPGGDETIGISTVIDAEPDGYTLGLTSATGIIVQPLVNDELTYKDPSDFTSIVKMVEAPNAIMVRAESPYESLDDLIEDAKSRPGEVRIGTTGRLTNNSFALAALEEQADIEIVIVPFSGGAGEAVLAALGGQIEAVIPTAAGQLGLIEAGDLRALAHTGSSDYDEFLPGAESFEAAGYDIPFSSDYLTVAAAGLPDAVRERLVEANLAVAESDEWAEWCADNGFLADPMAGDDLDQWIQDAIESSENAIELMDTREE